MILALFLATVWPFCEVARYEEPIHVPANVVSVDSTFYLLDAGLSRIVELSSDGLTVDIGGEGPGECSHPNSILPTDNGFAMLKPLKAEIIFTDSSRPSLKLPELMLARNLAPGYWVNGILFDSWDHVLVQLDSSGNILRTIIREPRMADTFPVWFFRSSWTVCPSHLVVETSNGLETYNYRGDLLTRRSLPPGPVGPSGGRTQAVLCIDEQAYVILRDEELVLMHVDTWTSISVTGVHHRPSTHYFWLDGHLVAVEGADGAIFGVDYGDEDRVIVIYRRQQ
jgi:hypothetical protein